ncbi:pyruvate kinase [Candidatus Nomurabacteria bacterium]|nr:MAG: pyruvate kinase [Candidatus Nomurabacteria bacterium]
MKNKTKIVATLGPSTEDPKILADLMKNGLSVARLNMSHGNHEEHAKRITAIREAEKISKSLIATLLDLSGPKIRTGEVKNGQITLKKGDSVKIVFKPIIGDENNLYINYSGLRKELKPGAIILLDDGKRSLCVTSIGEDYVNTKVEMGGMIRGRRGVNIPGANLKISAITEKDKKDLLFGIKQDVDFVALSFVRSVKDIQDLKRLLQKNKSSAKIVAKIETPEAVSCIDEIIKETDAIMVARGDLAIEVGIEKIPTIQKMIIEKCNTAGVPVIVATQMLLSMVENETPTRAEISDIANAIYDGADAIMLSEETAIGKYPKKVVSLMQRVACVVEENLPNYKKIEVMKDNIADSVSSSVVHNANQVGASAIIALTESGFTARMLSRYKSSLPIYAISSSQKTLRSLMISFGVLPIYHTGAKTFDEARKIAIEIAKEKCNLKKGEKYVIAAGLKQGKSGSTNLMLIENI